MADYFDKTLGNISQLYAVLPYAEVDGQLGKYMGGLNSSINSLSIDPSARQAMRTQMMQRLTDAANTAKLQSDPARYLTEQALARPPQERMADGVIPAPIRNNNPGGLKASEGWLGQTSADADGFAQFDNPDSGLLAWGAKLVSQQQQDGRLSTVQDIVSRNNSALSPANVAAIAKSLGAAPDEKIDLTRPYTLATLMHGMIRQEHGVQPYAEDSVMAAALKAAQPDMDVTPPSSSAAPAGHSATQQGPDGLNHVMNGSLAFTMGNADQQRRWLAQAKLSLNAQQAEAAQAARQQADAAERAQQQTASNLIDKFWGGSLTRNDVLNSGLPPGQQQQAIDMMARNPADSGNSALHRQLVMQALNGSVTDKSDLLPDMARPDGINPAQAQNVAEAAQLANEPYVKRFLTAAEPLISAHRFNGIADPDGDTQFSNMLFDLMGQIADARKKGLSPRDILDPASKYRIDDRLIAAHMRSASEISAAAADNVRKLSSLGIIETIKPGEDPTAFMNTWGQRR